MCVLWVRGPARHPSPPCRLAVSWGGGARGGGGRAWGRPGSERPGRRTPVALSCSPLLWDLPCLRSDHMLWKQVESNSPEQTSSCGPDSRNSPSAVCPGGHQGSRGKGVSAGSCFNPDDSFGESGWPLGPHTGCQSCQHKTQLSPQRE